MNSDSKLVANAIVIHTNHLSTGALTTVSLTKRLNNMKSMDRLSRFLLQY